MSMEHHGKSRVYKYYRPEPGSRAFFEFWQFSPDDFLNLPALLDKWKLPLRGGTKPSIVQVFHLLEHMPQMLEYRDGEDREQRALLSGIFKEPLNNSPFLWNFEKRGV